MKIIMNGLDQQFDFGNGDMDPQDGSICTIHNTVLSLNISNVLSAKEHYYYTFAHRLPTFFTLTKAQIYRENI